MLSHFNVCKTFDLKKNSRLYFFLKRKSLPYLIWAPCTYPMRKTRRSWGERPDPTSQLTSLTKVGYDT